ncbi:MAG TPA: hypothetical protein VGP93_21015 [Polyangiaceae bacterium]|nr:hypothetical protein [Polyangiaceae bacterium]
MTPSPRKPGQSPRKGAAATEKKTTSKPPPKEPEGGTWEASQPEIRVGYTAAGRETLEAITAEVVSEMALTGDGETPEKRASARQEQVTLPYADRIPNAPGAKAPNRPGGGHQPEPAPEISLRQSPAGRETLAAIEHELVDSQHGSSEASPEGAAAQRADPEIRDEAQQALEIFEMATFVVRGPEAAGLSTDKLRRRFIEEHLMHRLPVRSGSDIDRVDVTPWTVRGTFVVRVWCRVID